MIIKIETHYVPTTASSSSDILLSADVYPEEVPIPGDSCESAGAVARPVEDVQGDRGGGQLVLDVGRRHAAKALGISKINVWNGPKNVLTSEGRRWCIPTRRQRRWGRGSWQRVWAGPGPSPRSGGSCSAARRRSSPRSSTSDTAWSCTYCAGRRYASPGKIIRY